MDESSSLRNPLPDKLRKLVPMLGSPVDGERLAATHAIERAIRAAGLTFHDLAARLAHAGPREAKVFTQPPEQPDFADDFMVDSLLREVDRLAYSDGLFAHALRSVLDHGHRLTRAQRKRLVDLFDAMETA